MRIRWDRALPLAGVVLFWILTIWGFLAYGK